MIFDFYYFGEDHLVDKIVFFCPKKLIVKSACFYVNL